jgi:hypothetical protein
MFLSPYWKKEHWTSKKLMGKKFSFSLGSGHDSDLWLAGESGNWKKRVSLIVHNITYKAKVVRCPTYKNVLECLGQLYRILEAPIRISALRPTILTEDIYAAFSVYPYNAGIFLNTLKTEFLLNHI